MAIYFALSTRLVIILYRHAILIRIEYDSSYYFREENKCWEKTSLDNTADNVVHSLVVSLRFPDLAVSILTICVLDIISTWGATLSFMHLPSHFTTFRIFSTYIADWCEFISIEGPAKVICIAFRVACFWAASLPSWNVEIRFYAIENMNRSKSFIWKYIT